MIRIADTILKSDQTESEFRAQGMVRFWVRGAGGTWPSGATVKLQELTNFEGETAQWVDQVSWTAEGKHFVQLVPDGKYRILASATGIVVRASTYAESNAIMV